MNTCRQYNNFIVIIFIIIHVQISYSNFFYSRIMNIGDTEVQATSCIQPYGKCSVVADQKCCPGLICNSKYRMCFFFQSKGQNIPSNQGYLNFNCCNSDNNNNTSRCCHQSLSLLILCYQIVIIKDINHLLISLPSLTSMLLLS